MSDKHSEEQEVARKPLDYRDPRDDQPLTAQTELVVAAVSTAIIGLTAVPTLLYFAFTMDYRGAPPLQNGTTGIYIAFATWATLLLAMTLLTVRWWQANRRHRAFGIWIGL